ncbi:hypothetical protein N0V88_001395 [Collariella sp. IMI 366227]|nr:hypothetical protein N0V88_001395 [Collariella sp. IMI 366227]
MISWALKRKSDTARDAPVSDDTTQIDLPDTPAPVFAVRAFKTALFGTPAPRDRRPASRGKDKTAQQNANPPLAIDKSPAKPAGILLTPGTGTTRRKRVSFNHDVKPGSGGAVRTSTVGLPDDISRNIPTPWDDAIQNGVQSRPKTKLQQAMERSQKSNGIERGADEQILGFTTKEPEDTWEEVEEDESDFEGDVTTDLNEPHSRSGKYWKSYFETYHTDAKTEMEKLVKYKHLAKSYAKMKDAEALEVNQKLKEEQERVQAMEAKVTELTRQVALASKRKGAGPDPALVDELDKQTALAAEYKKQVEELEALLDANIDEEGAGRRRHGRTASPRTQRTIMETQRELRRARSQARELEKMEEERDRLRSDLKFAEQRASKLAEENRKLSGELSQSASRMQELEKKLEDSKGLYGKLKEDAKARYSEAAQVLHKKNEKISELEKELESLKKDGAELKRASRSARARTLDEKPTALKPLETSEARSERLLKELNERRASQKGLAASKALVLSRQKERLTTIENSKCASYDDPTLAQSRALREKLEAEFGTKGFPAAASVLSDRGNLQDSRSSASSGRSAHAREDDTPYPTRTTSKPTWAAATAAEKTTLDVLLAKTREKRASRTALENLGKVSRESAASVPDVDDDVQSRYVPIAAESSAIWSTMNTSRTTLPAHRKAAALERLERRKTERALQQRVGQGKENARP